jgi:hypothetical protein
MLKQKKLQDHNNDPENGKPDHLNRVLCPGCLRHDIHKKCPAHGTPFYMSGIPFTEKMEYYYQTAIAHEASQFIDQVAEKYKNERNDDTLDKIEKEILAKAGEVVYREFAAILENTAM